MKLIVELGLAAATAVSAQISNHLANGLDLDIDALPPAKLPNNDLAPVAVDEAAVSGEPLQQISSLITSLSAELEEFKGVAEYIKNVRANLDQGCGYIPDKEKGQCVDKCQNAPPTTVPPTMAPPDFPKILKDRCIKDEICAADDEECLTNCASNWEKHCKSETHNCFYTSFQNTWDSRDACFDQCRESVTELNTLLTESTAVTKAISVVTTIKTIDGHGKWSSEYRTDWLKGYCIKNGWCPEGNWDCYKECAKKITGKCDGGDYKCFYEDNKNLGSHATNKDCLNSCIDNKIQKFTNLSYDEHVFKKLKFRYMPRWDLEKSIYYLSQRCIEENICDEKDDDCITECAKQWRRYCNTSWMSYKYFCFHEDESISTMSTMWIEAGFKDRLECLDTCQFKTKKLRTGLISVMHQYRGSDAVANLLTEEEVVPDYIGSSTDMTREGVIRSVAERCVSKNICPGDNNKACLKKCGENYISCSDNARNRWNCFKKDSFDTYSTSDGWFEFKNRSDCLDSCESRYDLIRSRLIATHKQYNAEAQLILPPKHEGVFKDNIELGIDGYWVSYEARGDYFRSRCIAKNIRPDVEDYQVSSDYVNRDQQVTFCEYQYRRFTGLCFYEYDSKDIKQYHGFETLEDCIDDEEINNYTLRKELIRTNAYYFNETQPYKLLPSDRDAKILEELKQEEIKRKEKEIANQTVIEIKTIFVDGRENKWQRKIFKGVKGEWTRISGEDPFDAELKETKTETETVTFNGEDHIWTRTIVIGGAEGEWEQTAGSHKFSTPEEAEDHFQKLIEQGKF